MIFTTRTARRIPTSPAVKLIVIAGVFTFTQITLQAIPQIFAQPISAGAIIHHSPPAHPSHLIVKFKLHSHVLKELQMVQATSQPAATPRTTTRTTTMSLGDYARRGDVPVLQALFRSGVQTMEQLCPAASASTASKTNNAALAIGLDRIYVADVQAGQSVAEALAALKASELVWESVEYAEPDFIGFGGGVLSSEPSQLSGIVANSDPPASGKFSSKPSGFVQAALPNDPFFSQQWGLSNTGQTIGGNVGVQGVDVNAAQAWTITQGADSTIVAVLDSGIPVRAASFPDFAGRLLAGFDFVNNDNDPTDDHGHGSNVTSIATAQGNNSTGIAGMNWRCKILPVKILDARNSGLYSWWVQGIQFATDKGARVINLSVGGTGASAALNDAVRYAHSKGTIVLACVMNVNSETTYYPAAYPETIAVGAVNNRGNRAVPFCFSATSGSNFGNHLDLVAPGELIAGYRNTDGAVTYWCGTSQATPIVTGVVSLMLAVHPALTFDQIRTILQTTSTDRIGNPAEDLPGWDKYYGWGMLNAPAALRAAQNLTSPVTSVVAARASSVASSSIILDRVFPNPAQSDVIFALNLPQPARVRLTVTSVLGVVVEMMERDLPQGAQTLVWQSNQASAGVYAYRIEVTAEPRSGLPAVSGGMLPAETGLVRVVR
jgi:hypothetical protein